MSRIIEQEEAVNADSFLDIVASVVSVMIIMVVMTGLKIKNTALEALPTSGVVQAGGDLVRKQRKRRRSAATWKKSPRKWSRSRPRQPGGSANAISWPWP